MANYFKKICKYDLKKLKNGHNKILNPFINFILSNKANLKEQIVLKLIDIARKAFCLRLSKKLKKSTISDN